MIRLRLFKVALVSLLVSQGANAYDFEIDGIYYNKLSDTEIEVTSKAESIYQIVPTYTGWVVIPSKVEYDNTEYQVTTIGISAFQACTTLSSVSMPESVKLIKASAFLGCTELKSLTLPQGLTDIKRSAFSGCISLSSVNLPVGLTGISELTFHNCSSLTSVAIPTTVTSIGDGAFSGCSALATADIPSAVTSIGKNAFNGCSALTSVDLPKALTSIGNGVFSGCSVLEGVKIPESVTSIGDDAFKSCLKLGSITIPENVKSIGIEAFYGCQSVKELFFNAVNCPTVGGATFPSSISAITIGDKVTIIPNSFLSKGSSNNTQYRVSNIETVVLPPSVTTIGDGAFNGCSNLTKINIPEGVTSIGEYAFYKTSVKELNYEAMKCTVPVKYTNYSVFPATVEVLTFGDKVSVIPDRFLAEGSKVETLTLPESLTAIGASAFESNKMLTSIMIPEKVETIGSSAFYRCESLTDVTYNAVKCTSSMTLPQSVTTINIGEKVVSIPNNLCQGTKIKTVSFPESLQEIGFSAFKDCPNLETMVIPKNIIGFQKDTFSGCIFSKYAYPAHIQDKKQYITGRGIMYPQECYTDDRGVIYDAKKTILYYAPLNLTGDYQVENSALTIGENAFYFCSSLTAISIPENVSTIGTNAFLNCDNLVELNYQAINCGRDSTSTWPIFPGSIEKLTIGNKVEIIPDYFLNGRNSNWNGVYESLKITNLELPQSLTKIGAWAFANLKTPTTLTIPEGVQSLGDCAFYGWSALTSLSLPSSLATIGIQTFVAVSLKDVYSYALVPPTCQESSFGLMNEGKCNLSVPSESLEAYRNSPVWNKFLIKSLPVLVQAINVSPEKLNGMKGETGQLTATVSPMDATNQNLNWRSDNEEVATVDENGLVTFTGVGKTTITVSTTDGSDLSVSVPVEVGISSVEAQEIIDCDESFDIMTLNGLVIKRNASKSDLKTISRGIYLIKGSKTAQKVIIY